MVNSSVAKKPPISKVVMLCAAVARAGGPDGRGHGEEGGGADRVPLRPSGCPGQQRRYLSDGQHRDSGPGSVRQGHEHQRQVATDTPDPLCRTPSLVPTLDFLFFS